MRRKMKMKTLSVFSSLLFCSLVCFFVFFCFERREKDKWQGKGGNKKAKKELQEQECDSEQEWKKPPKVLEPIKARRTRRNTLLLVQRLAALGGVRLGQMLFCYFGLEISRTENSANSAQKKRKKRKEKQKEKKLSFDQEGALSKAPSSASELGCSLFVIVVCRFKRYARRF